MRADPFCALPLCWTLHYLEVVAIVVGTSIVMLGLFIYLERRDGNK